MGLNSEAKSCRICGKPLPEGTDCHRLYCDRCRQRRRRTSWRISRTKSYNKRRKAILADKKEEYLYYKSRGICVDCHQRDAAIADGKRMVRCPECMERQRKKKRLDAATPSPPKGEERKFVVLIVARNGGFCNGTGR